MTSFRSVDADRSTEYAVAASKGFSYYLPKSAQRHLRELLKQLPSAARSIYDEYCRDLMCAKACAPESAAAMVKFIISSFPNIAKKHNAFAREMNTEIDNNEHEGYEPTKFPIVAKPEVDDEEDATIADTGKKRKRAPAGSPSLPNQGGKPQKKTKIILDRIPAATSSSPTAPPSSPYRASRSPAQANPENARSEASNTHASEKDGVQSLTTESIKISGDDRDSRHSSPLSDAPSSSQLSNEDDLHKEWGIRPHANNRDLIKGQDNDSVSLIESRDQEHTLSPPPAQALLGSIEDGLTSVADKSDTKSEAQPDSETPRELWTVPSIPPAISTLQTSGETLSAASITPTEGVKGAEDAGILGDSFSDLEHTYSLEEVSWEDGMQAIEDFDWDHKGSQGLDGQGRISIHHDQTEQSAGVFNGNYWDDTDADRLFPGFEEDLDALNKEQAPDLDAHE